MLNELKLKALKPAEKLYKVSDRDGLYVAVLPSGTISFRYDNRFNDRREALMIGEVKPLLILVITFALAFLMVSTIKYRSFKDMKFRRGDHFPIWCGEFLP